MATKTARTQVTFVKRASAPGGSYWTSDASANQLLSYVRGLSRVGTKFASIGGEQEQGFEQAFSSLSYAYLKDKAPRLIDYIVGFQLVDRNEDNTKAVGVFGFKVGKQWLYAPVFFLNGDLKGHELLYIKQQDSFVPMKENWVNYIMSRKPHILGEGSQKDVYQLGGIAPQLDRFSSPPSSGGKFGSDTGTEKTGFIEHLVGPAIGLGGSMMAQHYWKKHKDKQNDDTEEKTKTASDGLSGVRTGGLTLQDWAIAAVPMIAALATKEARYLWSAAPKGTKLDMAKVAADPFKAALADVNLSLDTFLSEDVSLAEGAFDLTQIYPGLKLAFDKVHGPGFFKTVGMRLKEAAEASANSLIKEAAAPSRRQVARERRMNKVASIFGSLIPGEKTASAEEDKKPKVTILTDPDVMLTKNKPELTGEEKEQLLHHGYLVKDERKGEEISQAYNTQVRMELTNPHESGIYEVLEKPGTFERMLIISNPQSNGGGEDFCTVVRLGDGEKKWLNGHRTALFARKVELETDYRDWFDKLGDKDSVSVGGTYMAVSERGEGTVPFTVGKKFDDGTYEVDFKNNSDWKAGRSSDLPKTSYGNREYVSGYNALMMINERPGTKLRALAGTLHVPSTFKFLKLKDPPKPRKNDGDGEDCCMKSIGPSGYTADGSEPKPIQPGDISDIQLMFSEKTAAMKIWGDHSEVVIQTKQATHRLPWKQGLFSLIRDHGFSEKVAKELLKTAQVKAAGVKSGPCHYRVKYAGYYPNPDLQSGGPYAPVPPSPEYGSEPMGYNSVNAIYPQEEHVPVPGMDSHQTDPRIYDPFLMPDQNAVSTAQQAGQQGQKEVFDTAMIGGMLKAVRQDTLVDRYLGDLVKAVDKLGRLLFMFYWHQEEFAERYGKNDLPELEDSLRNAFETVGDVVLFLKEKTIEPGLDEMQDPSVEESSKN